MIDALQFVGALLIVIICLGYALFKMKGIK